MTTQTRHNVFETNSSSTHSISIAASSDGVYDTLPVSNDGVVVLHGGEFGWEWRKYHDAESKANYCAIYTDTYPDQRLMLIEVIREVTGATEVVFDFSSSWDSPHYSYIDHESYGVAPIAFTSKETLKDFIFNPKSVLRTGNDNDETPDGWYDEKPVKDDKPYLFSRDQLTDHLVKLLASMKKVNREDLLDQLDIDDRYAIEDVTHDLSIVIERLNALR